MKDNNKNIDVFENMPIAKAVSTMCIPTIIGQLIILCYSIADTFFVGRTNNPMMVAAASLILPLFNMALPLAALAGVGGGTLISRLLGEHREDEARKVCSFSIYFSIGIGFLFSLIVLIFMNPLLHVLGAGEGTYIFARNYALCVIVAGGIPTIMTNVLSNLVRSVGESKKAAFGITMGGVINIILDPVFMFLIFPKGQEIIGAGVATCLSNIISCSYFAFTVKQLSASTPLVLLKPSLLPQKDSIFKIYSVGIPSGVTTLLFDMDYIVLDKLMAGYSDIALAAIGIVLKAERLPLNVGIGICQGMVPIVAYNYGTGNIKRMRGIANFALKSGIICALIANTLYEIFASFIIRIFIENDQTVALGTNFLKIRCLATLLMFLSFYHVHLFNAYGRGGEALFLGVMRWAAFNIPMLFILNAIFGMYGLVWSQLAADILTVILSLAVHRRFLKKAGMT